jgi:hypothetical protein
VTASKRRSPRNTTNCLVDTLLIDTMVETNVFDQADSPPLVAATPADHLDFDFSLANAVRVEHRDVDPVVPVTVPIEPEDMDDQERHQNLTVGAGVAGGVVGLLIGGPILAILAGFGTAYATQQDGAAGDTARAVGQVALETKAKAQELDHKHNLVQKGQEAAADAWEKAKELDRKHNILERSQAFLVWSWQTILEQNRKHHLLERAVNATGRFLTFVFTKIGNAITSEQQARQERSKPPPTNPVYMDNAPTVAHLPPKQVVVN